MQRFKDSFFSLSIVSRDPSFVKLTARSTLGGIVWMCIAQASPCQFFVVVHKPEIQCYRARMMAKNMLYTHRNQWPACITRFPLILLKISSASLQQLFKVSGSNSCLLLPLQKDTRVLQSSLTLYGLPEEVVSEEISWLTKEEFQKPSRNISITFPFLLKQSWRKIIIST